MRRHQMGLRPLVVLGLLCTVRGVSIANEFETLKQRLHRGITALSSVPTDSSSSEQAKS